ncbi:hypothetical protein J2T55_000082 [Methylohalomonas lacus]|uniref:Uncharacterized protein n=1 Tax=Methylohalomonas lacus TaxID=398773 RepID=A0AAE3HHR2_9GAMM|nr:hypothetical protein [Methylohalomonas lacus]MCS3902090.1 hypothetical protein [Methylohalomonas lacus]
MTTANFTVVYNGDRVKNNTMDVRDLAPALLSIGSLVDEANRVLNGDNATVKLHVDTTAPGCFEINMLLDLAFLSQVKDFLTSDLVNSAINLNDLIWGGVGATWGLIGLAKLLKGKKPPKAERVDDHTVRIQVDGQTYDVPLKLLRLYQDLGVRNALEKTISPLKKEGIDSLEVKQEGKAIAFIEKKEADYFDAPQAEDEEILDEIEKGAYSILSVAFKEDNKWRLYDGNTTITASIKDEDFIYRVEHGLESFTKGDVLICEVRKRQYITGSDLKTEYEVERVIEHKKAARQINLDLDSHGDT